MTNWTDEKNEQLREMVTAGESFSKIAAKIGCTRNAAIGRARRQGFQQPKFTKAKRATPDMTIRLRPKSEQVNDALPEISTELPESANPCRIEDLKPCQCRYPVSRDSRGIQLFCAAPTPDRKQSYCAGHQGTTGNGRQLKSLGPTYAMIVRRDQGKHTLAGFTSDISGEFNGRRK